MTINILDINDNAPEFTPPSANVSFLENEGVGFEVANFTADDLDTGVNGEF